MSTLTNTKAGADTATSATPSALKPLSFAGILHAEWIKLISLRSTWWTAGAGVVLMVLLGLVMALTLDDWMAQDDMAAMAAAGEVHGAELIVGGYAFGSVAVAVLGALLITSEYGTGMIRSTLAAVPARLPVLAAKAMVLTAVAVVTGAISIAVTQLVMAPALADYDLVPDLGDATTWQIYGGTVFVFGTVALLALGLGATLRSSAGTITAVLGLQLLVPNILLMVNVDWVADARSYLPSEAAMAFVADSPVLGAQDVFTAGEGAAIVAAWSLAALGAGALLLHRRDA